MSAAVATGRRSGARPRIGLALAGGGPLGGIYAIGALLALAESLDGIDLNDLDVYVGVSSGGFVATALANQISPTQMYRLFIDDGADATLSPALFLRPAMGEFARRASSIPSLLVGAVLDYLRHPLRRGVMESLAGLGRAVPTGLFDQRAIDAFASLRRTDAVLVLAGTGAEREELESAARERGVLPLSPEAAERSGCHRQSGRAWGISKAAQLLRLHCGSG